MKNAGCSHCGKSEEKMLMEHEEKIREKGFKKGLFYVLPWNKSNAAVWQIRTVGTICHPVLPPTDNDNAVSVGS